MTELIERVYCTCKKWKKSAAQIFNAQKQYTLQTDVKYTGARFEFCPWCGRVLQKEIEIEQAAE